GGSTSPRVSVRTAAGRCTSSATPAWSRLTEGRRRHLARRVVLVPGGAGRRPDEQRARRRLGDARRGVGRLLVERLVLEERRDDPLERLAVLPQEAACVGVARRDEGTDLVVDGGEEPVRRSALA